MLQTIYVTREAFNMSGNSFYVKDFVKRVRADLRLLLTGSIHYSDIKNGRYPPALERLHHCLPISKYYKAKRRNATDKKEHEHFIMDSYINNNNYLIELFRIKSFTPDQMTVLLMIMQIISGNPDKGLTHNEFINGITKLLPDDAKVEKMIPRYLKRLCTLGILRKERDGNTDKYYLMSNRLEGLSKEEYKELLLAIGFYKNISFFGVPGYFLETNLQSMYASNEKLPQIPAQFHNKSMLKLIDEEILQRILDSKNEHRLLIINYRNRKSKELKEYTVYPICVREDFFHGDRQYMYCLPWENDNWAKYPLTLPVESIESAELGPIHHVPLPKLEYDNDKTYIEIRISYENEEKQKNCINRIRSRYGELEEYPRTTDDIATSSCRIGFFTDEPNSIIPFVQEHYPYMIVLKAPEDTLQRIHGNIEEALAYYGQE